MAFLFYSCNDNKDQEISIIWHDGKAAELSIPAKLTGNIPADSIAQLVQVKLQGYEGFAAILGRFTGSGNIIFKPLLPFSPGMVYDVFIRNIKQGSFHIPIASTANAPRVLAVYPTPDTLPDNLLKIYLQFSHPMQESRSAAFVKLIRNGTDTLHDVFLDLQPELWNGDRTVLTMWLDPGRIKRDLQPNLRLGTPLKKNDRYTLVVSQNWKDGKGVQLRNDHIHSFITAGRDSIGPDPSHWKIRDSIIDEKQTISIDLIESLDHFLLLECLWVTDEKGKKVWGNFLPDSKDRHCIFNPQLTMPPGNYLLHVASKLEDLAGNNLNRPFDRDITNSKLPSNATDHTRKFTISAF